MATREVRDLSRYEQVVMGLFAVAFVGFLGGFAAEFLVSESWKPVTDVSAGVLELLFGVWMVTIWATPDDWWAVVGAAGFGLAGATEFVLLVQASEAAVIANGFGFLVGAAAFVYGVVYHEAPAGPRG